MATRPASRQRKAGHASAAAGPKGLHQHQQQLPQSGSPTSTATTTTSSSRLTPELSLDGPVSPLFAGLDEDPAPKENVTVTVRFRPLRFSSLWLMERCLVWLRLDSGNVD
jgi:centromeric protein E